MMGSRSIRYPTLDWGAVPAVAQVGIAANSHHPYTMSLPVAQTPLDAQVRIAANSYHEMSHFAAQIFIGTRVGVVAVTQDVLIVVPTLTVDQPPGPLDTMMRYAAMTLPDTRGRVVAVVMDDLIPAPTLAVGRYLALQYDMLKLPGAAPLHLHFPSEALPGWYDPGFSSPVRRETALVR